MKKKNFNKKLSLGKKQISKLGDIKGGAPASHLTCTIDPGGCGATQDLFTCTWVSELYTACYCEPSWHTNCPTINIPCPGTMDLACGLESVRICEA
ncbi:hypothetical protein [Kordia sp.]|uniref:hypothetical protein n=1 Tax=Kordia sp. TaxID=1965332 RepID=UPI0025B878A8|nr:hypothetical protein [Kordia sp.]MCH2194152.1 hypothetical protein [Kordia sp.]